jgi:alpha-tubulin suppressor-like RCC1 family protein
MIELRWFYRPLYGMALLVAACSGSTQPHAPPPAVASVDVTPAPAGVVIGQTLQLTATVRDSNGNQLSDRAVTWTTNAPTLASVSASGLITGIALADTVVITATSEGKRGSTTLAVVMNIGGEWNFTEQFGGTNSNNGSTVTCSDTGSYQFTQNGAALDGTGTQVGTCLGPLSSLDNSWLGAQPIADGLVGSKTLTFQSGGCQYTADVAGPPPSQLSGTVSCGTWSGTWEAVPGGAPVASVLVRWDVQTVVGGAVQLVAVARDAAGHMLNRVVTWSSDNASLAPVSASGLVSTLGAGSARVTATSEGKSGAATVTADLVSFASVSAGFYHSCAVTTSGVAYCWGWGGEGQLGTGFRPAARAPFVSAQTPLAVTGGHAFASVVAAYDYSCGLTTSGEAYCWGENVAGRLGDGSTTSSLAPVLVAGGQQFASVTLGAFYACGLTTASALYCWGNNSSGQFGDGTQTSSSSPVPAAGGLPFQSVRAGSYHMCGVTAANVAYCWGFNLDSQVGNGSAAFRVSSPDPVGGSHSFVAVAAGFSHSCGMTPEGAAYCWGFGELTGGSDQDQPLPVLVAGGPTFASAGGSLSAGQENSCALTSAGAAYCWGHSDVGQLGNGSTSAPSTPVAVLGGLSFASIKVGLVHTCGVTTGAVAYCWGFDGNGQLGAPTAESCVVDGYAYPCATTPARVIGTVQASGAPRASASRMAGIDARMRAADPAALLRMVGPPVSGPAPGGLAGRR